VLKALPPDVAWAAPNSGEFKLALSYRNYEFLDGVIESVRLSRSREDTLEESVAAGEREAQPHWPCDNLIVDPSSKQPKIVHGLIISAADLRYHLARNPNEPDHVDHRRANRRLLMTQRWTQLRDGCRPCDLCPYAAALSSSPDMAFQTVLRRGENAGASVPSSML
jgi:hypothetical protein